MDNTNKNSVALLKNVRIYQIQPRTKSEYMFNICEFMTDKKFTVPPADLYRVVFDSQLETENVDDIFKIFNIKHPSGYIGRSLSVSDIVEFYDKKSSKFFYCDYTEFKNIKFKPIKYQYMLITVNERDIINIKIFPNIMRAQNIMKEELFEQLDGSFDNYKKEDEYGFYETSAWSNPGGNWSWEIIELFWDKKFNIKLELNPQKF